MSAPGGHCPEGAFARWDRAGGPRVPVGERGAAGYHSRLQDQLLLRSLLPAARPAAALAVSDAGTPQGGWPAAAAVGPAAATESAAAVLGAPGSAGPADAGKSRRLAASGKPPQRG